MPRIGTYAMEIGLEELADHFCSELAHDMVLRAERELVRRSGARNLVNSELHVWTDWRLKFRRYEVTVNSAGWTGRGDTDWS